MAHSGTRSSTDVWLLAPLIAHLPGSKLPTIQQTLSLFYHHHYINKLTINEAAKETVKQVMVIWNKAGIPTSQNYNVINKVKKLVQKYINLKKNRGAKSESQKKSQNKKEAEFKEQLNKLFDIAHVSALKNIKIESDRLFLMDQRGERKFTMSTTVDKKLEKTQKKIIERRKASADQIRKDSLRREVEEASCSSLNIEFSAESQSSAEESTQDDSDFEEPEPKKIKKVKQRKYVQNFFSSEVTSTLDRVALSDRTATFIIAATASSLGHETSSMPLSRSSIRRKRLVNRKACVETVKHSFNPDIPLIVHWDGKLLPDIKGKGKVDRLPILVTGKGVEKLLAVPKLKDGKSETISKAVVETLENWNLKNSVVGMCFDTTSSNTGRNGGACLLVERSLNKKLLYLACRHHIHELIVADVFKQLFGHSSGPNIQLFKRFQEHWEFIDRANFQTYESNEYLCDKMQSDLMQELRKDALEFGAKTLSENLQTRDDYRELIELCIIFLGGVPKRGIHFMAPGAFHHARWMAKCIYALKIYLFRSQFKLTCQEEKALAEMSLFISTVYMKSWIQSTEATSAPVNDLNLLKQLDLYKSINNEVSEIAVKKLKKHNWYLHEDLVCLSLFSDVVNSDVKMKMVNALSEKSECDVPLDNLHSLSVDSFVTERSASLLNALEIDTAFMDFPPTEWPDLLSYQQAQLIVRGVTVVNDCAERGVALITQYNSVITNNEEQKQYLLQVVSEHRRKYQSPAKSVLLGDC